MGVAAASACLPKVILEVSLDGVLRAVVVQPSQEHLAIGDILPRVHVAPAMCAQPARCCLPRPQGICRVGSSLPVLFLPAPPCLCRSAAESRRKSCVARETQQSYLTIGRTWDAAALPDHLSHSPTAARPAPRAAASKPVSSWLVVARPRVCVCVCVCVCVTVCDCVCEAVRVRGRVGPAVLLHCLERGSSMVCFSRSTPT